jgi:hypothetical protein
MVWIRLIKKWKGIANGYQMLDKLDFALNRYTRANLAKSYDWQLNLLNNLYNTKNFSKIQYRKLIPKYKSSLF